MEAYRYIRFVTSVLSALIVLSGCDAFEHTPFQHTSPAEPSNDWNLRKLKQQENTDSIVKVAFIGDTQRFYSDTKDVVEYINKIPDVDLVLISGDITDFGLYIEFEEMARVLQKLNAPFFSVIGNHDMINNGARLYQDHFGNDHQLFEYSGYYFLLHNTNSISVAFDGSLPDLPKIKGMLEGIPDEAPIIAVSHVPPHNVDFDPNLHDDYERLWAEEGVILSLNGHNHAYNDWKKYGVQYINSSSPSKGELVMITLADSSFTFERHAF